MHYLSTTIFSTTNPVYSVFPFYNPIYNNGRIAHGSHSSEWRLIVKHYSKEIEIRNTKLTSVIKKEPNSIEMFYTRPYIILTIKKKSSDEWKHF